MVGAAGRAIVPVVIVQELVVQGPAGPVRNEADPKRERKVGLATRRMVQQAIRADRLDVVGPEQARGAMVGVARPRRRASVATKSRDARRSVSCCSLVTGGSMRF